MHITMNLGSPRTWVALISILTVMAIYSRPEKDVMLMPDPKRPGWRRWLPPFRSRREPEEEAGEREAMDFLDAITEPRPVQQPEPQREQRSRGRHRIPDRPQPLPVRLPWFEHWSRPDLDAYGAPWPPAPAPVPEDTGSPEPEPAPPAAPPGKPPRLLDTWRPGDPGDPPTLVGGMLPVIDESIAGYLGTWPSYGDEEGPDGS